MVEENNNVNHKNFKILTVEEMSNFCKKKGFVYQTAEIYGGFAGFFDFGSLGVELKNNIKKELWNFLIYERNDIVGLDGSIITNPKIWEASGHTEKFGDLILTCKKCKTKIRADHFIEDELDINAEGISAGEINELIKKHNLKCKKCGGEFEEVKDFNLMFTTNVGPNVSKENTAYLRPETAQSIFPNFKLIQEHNRLKLPFGIAQVGKAFRNEISPRDFLFRMREFEQFELEYFIKPTEFKCSLLTEKHLNTEFNFWSSERQLENNKDMEKISIKELLEKNKLDEWHAYWLAEFLNFYYSKLNFKTENIRVREHIPQELSHYSSATFDIDYKFPFGYKEVHGMANRGQYDITQHIKYSKANLDYFDEEEKKKVIPRVIEPSQGIERLFLAILFEAYQYDNDRGNVVLKFPKILSPYKVAVFPLVNKEELPEIAGKIAKKLRSTYRLNIFEDYSGSIGRRYARQDEIGTPYCITVDFDTVKDNTVTIRDRDTTKQERVHIDKIGEYLFDKIFN